MNESEKGREQGCARTKIDFKITVIRIVYVSFTSCLFT